MDAGTLSKDKRPAIDKPRCPRTLHVRMGLGGMWILDWLLASIIAGVVGYIFWVNFIKKHLGGTGGS